MLKAGWHWRDGLMSYLGSWQGFQHHVWARNSPNVMCGIFWCRILVTGKIICRDGLCKNSLYCWVNFSINLTKKILTYMLYAKNKVTVGTFGMDNLGLEHKNDREATEVNAHRSPWSQGRLWCYHTAAQSPGTDSNSWSACLCLPQQMLSACVTTTGPGIDSTLSFSEATGAMAPSSQAMRGEQGDNKEQTQNLSSGTRYQQSLLPSQVQTGLIILKKHGKIKE